MKVTWFLAAVVVVLAIGGCAKPPVEAPVTPSSPAPVASKAAAPLEHLSEMSLRGLVADSAGRNFIVQDQKMSLYLIGAGGGKTHLGEAPAIDLLAAWGHNDYGYAFARKSESGSGYEIVGVGHSGSNVLTQTAGYPGALWFVGQEVHFVDLEGWKTVNWEGETVLQGPLDLGPRANQAAWCARTDGGPVCVGGYWGGSGETGGSLTVARAGAPAQTVMPKGEFPILASGAVSGDGRVMAASLGARSAGADEPNKVVVAWLDEAGVPVKTREFPLLARELAFDAYGRLIATVFPMDGSGNGQIVFLNLEDGSASPVPGAEAEGLFKFVMAPGGTKLYLLLNRGVQEVSLSATS